MEQVASTFARLASSIDERKSDDVIHDLLTDLQAACQGAASVSTPETKTLLANLTTAVGTWQQVWPRMGKRSEFRQACAREARLWSKRLLKPPG